MADGPAVLFVNLRRTRREQLESLLAARRLGYGIVMLAEYSSSYLRRWVQ